VSDLRETASTVSAALKHLGFGAPFGILWTLIMCVALYRADSSFLDKNWPWLYWTWVVIAGLWLVGGATIALWNARRASVPEELEPVKIPEVKPP